MYLKRKQVKGYHYWQLIEAYREEGRKRERVLLHLGPDLEDPATIVKWWKFLGEPLIPTHRGREPGKPAGVIRDVQKFLDLNYSRPDAQAIIKVLKQLGLPTPGVIAPIHDAAGVIDPIHDAATAAAPGQAQSPGPDVYIVPHTVIFDPEAGQISKSEP